MMERHGAIGEANFEATELPVRCLLLEV